MTDLPGGVRIRFAEGVDVTAAIAHMHCHMAFARSRGHSGMETCPLYLEALTISRVGSSSDVDVIADDEETRSALRARFRDHVVRDGGS